MKLPKIAKTESVRKLIKEALTEDVGNGDVTSIALIERGTRIKALIIARKGYTVSGHSVAAEVFKQVDRKIKYVALADDGCNVKGGSVIASIEGPARSILTAERTALNFMQRMTGISTLTRQFVNIAGKHGVKILDTRKTTPGLRIIEKYAVLCGGGINHRMGLYDRFLIKDNHRRLWKGGDPSSLDKAIVKARQYAPKLLVEIEVESLAELRSALKAKPDWILLDNMGGAKLRQCVKLCRGRTMTEASGGITLNNIKEIARSGIDAISLGCLTHSAPAADLSLEIA